MARPRLKPSLTAKCTLTIKLSAEDYAELRAEAEKRHIPVSMWARAVILDRPRAAKGSPVSA